MFDDVYQQYRIHQALWFANNPALKGVVILRPAWFFDVIRAVFRHDLDEKLAVEVEDSFRMIGTSLPVVISICAWRV